MKHRLRRLLASLTLAAGAVAPWAAPQAVCASGSSAALVVDTGGPTLTYCVDLRGQASVSGIELIKLASKQHGLSYSLGYGGQGVCMLAGIGSSTNECFEDDKPYFWGYWRGTGNGGWTWSSTGAGNTRVGPGDIDGWAWGTGNNGSTHPQPPQTTYADVCGPEQDKNEERDRDGGDRDGGDRDGGDRPGGPEEDKAGGAAPRNPRDPGKPEDQGGAQPKPGNERADGAADRDGGGAPSEESTVAAPAPLPVGTTDAATAQDVRPPVGLIAGLVLIATLVAAGFAIDHRRRERGRG